MSWRIAGYEVTPPFLLGIVVAPYWFGPNHQSTKEETSIVHIEVVGIGLAKDAFQLGAFDQIGKEAPGRDFPSPGATGHTKPTICRRIKTGHMALPHGPTSMHSPSTDRY